MTKLQMRWGWCCLALASLALSACGGLESQDSEESTFQQKAGALRGSAFGLSSKELVLTLDDGPGPFTLGLARYLEHKKIPAVFFVNFENGTNGINSEMGRKTMAALCRFQHIDVGNHSDFHNTRARTWNDISRVHNYLTNTCGKNWMYFRAPGGNWKSTDADVLNNFTDDEGRNLSTTYIGPVYWDFGGDAPGADWHPDCKKDSNWCRSAYKYEIQAANSGGIVLTHDIHASTIEMLLGENWRALVENPAAQNPGDGLLSVMEKAGYTWVSLSKNRNLVSALLGRQLAFLGQ